MRRAAFGRIVFAVAVAAMIISSPARACVGRTIVVGYHDAPDQVIVANILAVLIDERTGTTVKLSRFHTREEAFEAIRQDKVSLYSDYSSVLLSKFAGERGDFFHCLSFCRESRQKFRFRFCRSCLIDELRNRLCNLFAGQGNRLP